MPDGGKGGQSNCRSSYFSGGPRAKVGDNQADFFVRDFGRESFLEGFQAVHSQLAAGGRDLVVALGGEPARLKFGIAPLDKIGYQGNNSAQRSLPNLRNLSKRAAFFEQALRFFCGGRNFLLVFIAGTLSLAEAVQRLENFLAVHFDALVAEARDAAKFLESGRFRQAQIRKSGVVQDDKGCDSFLSCGISPPLAEILFQLDIGQARHV
jgi:hypothetical protein